MNRRDLLRNASLTAASLSLARFAPAARTPASDKLTVACIGVGSQGTRVLLDLLRLTDIQVVAVCDCNRGSADYLDWGGSELRTKVRAVLGDPAWGANLPGPVAGRDIAQSIVNASYARQTGRAAYSACNSYEDFRELLAREKDLDAVIVSTPDHWHAPIAIAAMRAGKHVYSQKPMAHSVRECRAMAHVAAETGRATQVSIFNSNTPASARVRELLASGVIGPVRSVDIWTKRASKFWHQGLPTPAEPDPIPAGFNWDMWLGPAPMRPFNRAYLPFVWRAWYDFGCGALGDMGEYGFDTIARALDLGPADTIEASTTDPLPDCYPVASAVHFHFPRTTARPDLQINWFDGGIEPRRPAELPPAEPIGTEGEGVLYTGDHGRLMTAFMGQHPRIIAPAGRIEQPFGPYTNPKEPFLATAPELGPTATSADAPHYLEWVNACRGGPPARANYAFEAPIVESLLLGCIAVRTHEALSWNAASGTLTDASPRANALLDPQTRSPWVA